MPSTTPKQARTMAAVAHGWHPPAESGIDIPVKVATEFNEADKQKRLAHQLRRDAKKGVTP